LEFLAADSGSSTDANSAALLIVEDAGVTVDFMVVAAEIGAGAAAVDSLVF
jgi:hypothetical protein